MKLQGKISIWFWIILIAGNAFMLYGLCFAGEQMVILILTLILYNIIFLPIVIRNYVLIEDGNLKLVFGFARDSMEVEEIISVRHTWDPIASSAASLDRIVIKSRRKEIMCSVRDKQKLYDELKRLNPEIRFE